MSDIEVLHEVNAEEAALQEMRRANRMLLDAKESQVAELQGIIDRQKMQIEELNRTVVYLAHCVRLVEEAQQ